MKQFKWILPVLALLALLAGCGGKTMKELTADRIESSVILEETQINNLGVKIRKLDTSVGMDSAASPFALHLSRCGVGSLTEAESGYYFVKGLNRGNYIFYMEKGSRESTPLCKKANCLHDAEPDEQKRLECEAYVINPQWISFDQGKNVLYVICVEYSSNANLLETVLKAYDANGSFLKNIRTFSGNVSGLAMHYGVLYYNELLPNEDGSVSVSWKAYSLVEDRLYMLDEMESIPFGVYSDIKANGDTLMAERICYDEEGESDRTLLLFNVKECSLTEIRCVEDGCCLSDCFFYQDGLIYTLYNGDADEEAEKRVYYMDYAGEEQKEIGQIAFKNGILTVAGDYILATNVCYPERNKTEYQLLKDFSSVATFDLGELNGVDFSNRDINSVYFLDDGMIFEPFVMGGIPYCLLGVSYPRQENGSVETEVIFKDTVQ